MRGPYCFTWSSVVTLSVCIFSVSLLVTFVSCAKMAKPIKMLFSGLTRVGPRNHVLDAVMGKSQSRLRFKSRFEHLMGVIQQFKDSIRQPTIGIRFDWVFFAIQFGCEIRPPNHCWLLLISPFQCLVVSPVELNGFHL